ncbi:unnamed protein product [Rotaria sp. Silwood2]|nr:unnamed protein product [Rotaria sp. Silwood2]CAF4093109.1 unnamed protein product [Rotaria sp. Silwood2]
MSEQIDCFYANGLTLQQFTNLQSLMLCGVGVNHMLDRIQIALPQLPHITHLTLDYCTLGYNRVTILPLINIIWSLPKLSYCYFINSITFCHDQALFVPPTVASSTITHLTIWNIDDPYCEMAALFEQTPYLQHFSVSAWTYYPDFRLTSSVPSIITLKISGFPYKTVCDLLQRLPNLSHLYLGANNSDDHQQWEELIGDFLPKLKKCQFNGRLLKKELLKN